MNAADQPEDCDFYLPAVLARGDVIVAVGTGGAAPSLAAELKGRLGEALPAEVGEFAEALAEIRTRLRRKIDGEDRRGLIMRELAGVRGLEAFARGGPDALQEMLAKLLAGQD